MIVTAVLASLMLCALLVLYIRITRIEDGMLENIGNLALEVSNLMETQNKINKDFAETIDSLTERVDGLPVEDLQAKYDAEQAWNEGVQAILNYGLDKINKGDNNV